MHAITGCAKLSRATTMLRVHGKQKAERRQSSTSTKVWRATTYYNNQREIKGPLDGRGLQKGLNLTGDVERGWTSWALVNNRDPNTGKRLTPRNKADRRARIRRYPFGVEKALR